MKREQLPPFGKVLNLEAGNGPALWPTSVLICYAVDCGRAVRYNVFRIDHRAHTIKIIGRDLDIKTARRVAKRWPAMDGAPLGDQ